MSDDDDDLACVAAQLYTVGALMDGGCRAGIHIVRLVRRDGELVDVGCQTAESALRLLAEIEPPVLEIVCGSEEERAMWRELTTRDGGAVLH